MAAWTRLMLNHRVLVIISTLVITAVFGFFIKDLRVNPDLISTLPESDSVVVRFNYMGEEYGGSLLAMIVVTSPDVFSENTLVHVKKLTEELKVMQGISSVTSMFTILDISSSQEGLEIRRLVDPYDIPDTPEESAALRSYVLSKDMYVGHIVSADGQTTLIICRLQQDVDEVTLTRKMSAAANDLANHHTHFFGGLPFLMKDISDIVARDIFVLIPIVALIIIIVLLCSFRSIAGVLLPLLSVGMSTLWTLGLMSVLQIPLVIVSDIIPVILFAVGSAYSIHVISRFREPSQDPLAARLHTIMLPVMLATLTTILGFLSFVFGSYLAMIREFGLFTACGVAFSCILSLTFLPCVYSFMPQRRARAAARGPIMPKPLRRLTRMLIIERPVIVLAIGGFVLLAAGYGISRIQRQVDLLSYLKPETDIRRSEAIIEEKFGGSTSLEILVQGDIQDPEVLRSMMQVQDFLASHHDIHNVQSIADLIEEMSYNIGEGRVIPETRAQVVNLMFLLEGEEIVTNMVKNDYSEAVIRMTISGGMKIDRVNELVKEIEHYINGMDRGDMSMSMSGMPLINQRLDENVQSSQRLSLIIAALLIFILVCIQLGSIAGGAISLIPIVFALAGMFGVMGYARIPLDIATVLVGSVSIGIGIDYAIHFLHRLRLEYDINPVLPAAVLNTLRTTGRAILINVIAVSAGFLVLLRADVIPLQRFGILVSATMVFSGFGAVVIIPALLIITRLSFTKKIKGGVHEATH